MRPLVVFDGVCNLCEASVEFILQRDPEQRFLFASNQSAAGRTILETHGIEPTNVSTIYLIEDRRVFERSTAALRIARGLRFPWWLAGGLLLVPRPIRDLFYNLIASNRYRLFGKRPTCRIPTPEERSRFLEEVDDLRALGSEFAVSNPVQTEAVVDRDAGARGAR